MLRLQYIFLLLGLVIFSAKGQTPFTCEGQVWVIQRGSKSLLQMRVGANNGISTNTIKDDIGEEMYAIGFRKTDRLLYGIHPQTHELFRMDANGNLEIIAAPDVDPGLLYLAGDVTPDGKSFVVVGSNTDGLDVKISSINLESGDYEVQETNLGNATSTVDIAFHPITGLMYGFDTREKQFYTINLVNNRFEDLSTISIEHDVEGIYFDAFGEMFGLGTALFGVVGGLFEVNQTSGLTRLISTSGLIQIADVAGCPFSVELNSKITPEISFPCSDLTFEHSFANQTLETIENVLFEHELPAGYTFVQPIVAPFGGVIDNTTSDNFLRIENLKIPTGIHSFEVNAYVDDIAEETYKSQATLYNIPIEFGSMVISNDPVSPATEDSTRMKINRIEEDSLTFYALLCEGNSLMLDASEYGNNLSWSTGASSQQIEVFETGQFTLTAVSGCQELFVSYDVVSASCPYTIELRHTIQPDTVFRCSEALFRYILENDSGEEREGATLLDTLPPGVSFLRIENDPYQGQLTPNLPPNVFQLENLQLHTGVDTIDVVVQIGDVSVGSMRNTAVITDLPQVLQETRSSDDPATSAFGDSTTFFVRGVEEDSLQIDTILCRGDDLLLDVSLLGESFLWEDGSMEGRISISEIGDYEVLILGGCDSSIVTIHVEDAKNIQIEFRNDFYQIRQGESVELNPIINNSGDSLLIDWNDAMSSSLSCLDCLEPIATPLSDITYAVYVENETCADSTSITIFVDETRRVFIPSAFSPNNDGINDYFFFQSADPATVLSFQVFDRWGGLIFEAADTSLNQEQEGWDGLVKGKPTSLGVYIWQAEIQFFDGKVERWSGEVSVVR